MEAVCDAGRDAASCLSAKEDSTCPAVLVVLAQGGMALILMRMRMRMLLQMMLLMRIMTAMRDVTSTCLLSINTFAWHVPDAHGCVPQGLVTMGPQAACRRWPHRYLLCRYREATLDLQRTIRRKLIRQTLMEAKVASLIIYARLRC